MRSDLVLLAILLGGMILSAGCAMLGSGSPSFSVTADGYLDISCPAPAAVNEQVLEQNASITLSEVSFRNIDEEVYGLLAAPPGPRGAVILAPGAGVTKEDERGRVEAYALAGCAALVLDLRGNGGETPGYPFNPQADFNAFNESLWPEFYKTVCDLMASQELVSGRWKVPVYAMGASNGGRYAAIAAAADQAFAGYIGVSTSGFGLAGDEYTGNASRFLLSIDPDHSIGEISPRPVWIFHSRTDPIINFTYGQELYGRAGEPKEFIVFNGSHGENSEVDARVEGICAPA